MCTRDEVLTFKKSEVLFPSVPVSYVITMEGSKRRTKLLKELQEYKPTVKVVIVHHKPMSECLRPGWVKDSSQDLWNNNLNILKRDYEGPSMILEDDVQFLPRVREYAKRIDDFVREDKCDAYSLGTAPIFSIPAGWHVRIFMGGAAHALVRQGLRRRADLHDRATVHHPQRRDGDELQLPVQ